MSDQQKKPRRIRPHLTARVMRGLELGVRSARDVGAPATPEERKDLATAEGYLRRMRKYREAIRAEREELPLVRPDIRDKLQRIDRERAREEGEQVT